MPKLPDIEYSVNVQGPPNVTQALGSISDALMGLQKVQHDATMAFAEEQAKTQVSDASLLVEQGLADTEVKLKKPFLSPAEVKTAFPNGAPPEVQAVLDRYQDENAAAVPTHEVGAAIHAEVGKRLREEAVPLVYSAKVRSEFERKLESETLHRNIRVGQEMMAQGAELNAAKDISLAEARARVAVTPADWAGVNAAISNSGWLAPAKKEALFNHFAALQDTQGKKVEAAGIAESALAAGRDGVTPWVDPAKANAAFEKSIEGKNPLVAEDARQRYTHALSMADAARQAADAPSLGRLETRLYQGAGLSRLAPDYQALSPAGKAHIEKLAEAERRLSRSATLAEKSEQRALDAAALMRFRALDIKDQVAVKPRGDNLGAALGDPSFASVSGPGRDAIVVEWKKANATWAKDQGVSERDFLREADDLAVGLGFKKKGAKTEKSETFHAYLSSAYREWQQRQPPDGPTKPSVTEKDAMIRSALDYGDKGFPHFSGNKFRFEVKPGDEFTTEGFKPEEQKGHKQLDALKPKKVTVRRNGVIGTVTTPLPGDEVIP